DWSSDVCSSDLGRRSAHARGYRRHRARTCWRAEEHHCAQRGFSFVRSYAFLDLDLGKEPPLATAAHIEDAHGTPVDRELMRWLDLRVVRQERAHWRDLDDDAVANDRTTRAPGYLELATSALDLDARHATPAVSVVDRDHALEDVFVGEKLVLELAASRVEFRRDPVSRVHVLASDELVVPPPDRRNEPDRCRARSSPAVDDRSPGHAVRTVAVGLRHIAAMLVPLALAQRHTGAAAHVIAFRGQAGFPRPTGRGARVELVDRIDNLTELVL